jgi:hypothetical protein
MKCFRIELEKRDRIEAYVFAKSRSEGIAEAASRNKGFKPTAVDGDDVVGMCEDCRKWIADGDAYHTDSDCVILCDACYKRILRDQP